LYDFEGQSEEKNENNSLSENKNNFQKEFINPENNFQNLKIVDKKIETLSFDIKEDSECPRPDYIQLLKEVEQPDVTPLFNKFISEVKII
jgi:hypothetical protein